MDLNNLNTFDTSNKIYSYADLMTEFDEFSATENVDFESYAASIFCGYKQLHIMYNTGLKNLEIGGCTLVYS